MIYLLFHSAYVLYLDGGIANRLQSVVYIGLTAFFVLLYLKKQYIYFYDAKSIIVFWGIIAVITLFCGGLNADYYITIWKMIVSAIFMGYCWRRKRVQFINTLELVMRIQVILNLISQIVFPDGIHQTLLVYSEWYTGKVPEWFLGNKNTFIEYVLMLLLASGLRAYEENKKIVDFRFCFNYIICVISVIMGQSTTSLMVLIGLGCYILFQLLNEKYNKMNAKLIIFVIIMIEIILLVNSELLGNIIYMFTGKSASLSNRVPLWKTVFEYVLKKPIFGYGYLPYNIQRAMFGSLTYNSTHNMFFQVLLYGGFVLLFYYMSYVIKIVKNAFNLNDRKRILLIGIMIAILIEGICESLVVSVNFWGLIQILYCEACCMVLNDTNTNDNLT